MPFIPEERRNLSNNVGDIAKQFAELQLLIAVGSDIGLSVAATRLQTAVNALVAEVITEGTD